MWQMQITPANLQKKAQILHNIRAFFMSRNVCEVDVPILSQAPVTDPFLDNFKISFAYSAPCDGDAIYYLQTSPEYGMKRMLASGSGDIYYLGKAFRHEPQSPQHNPEFTMLEWYRIGFDDRTLMHEVAALLEATLGVTAVEYLAYDEAFLQYCQIDIWTATHQELVACYTSECTYDLLAESRDHVLQLLFSEQIEPKVGKSTPCFIYDFPASQSALAKLKASEQHKAHRFEVYFKGLELANGYYELTDPEQLQQRWQRDNATRQKQGLPQMPHDERLVAALHSGLPDCAGVALGVDRLLMLALAASDIQSTLAFGFTDA